MDVFGRILRDLAVIDGAVAPNDWPKRRCTRIPNVTKSVVYQAKRSWAIGTGCVSMFLLRFLVLVEDAFPTTYNISTHLLVWSNPSEAGDVPPWMSQFGWSPTNSPTVWWNLRWVEGSSWKGVLWGLCISHIYWILWWIRFSLETSQVLTPRTPNPAVTNTSNGCMLFRLWI